MLDVYHHFDYPEAMLEHIRDSLLSDGKLVIVEYFKRPGAMPGGDPNRAVEHIRLDQDDVIKEVEVERIPADVQTRSGAEEPVHRDFCEEVNARATIRLRPATYSGEVAEWSKAAVC